MSYFFSSRRRHTRCALVTGFQTCALPILLTASLPFGLYPERRTIKMLERDFRMPVKAAALMVPIQTDFRGGGRPALLYVGRKGLLVTLDLFDPRINNYNFVVAAESGAGKRSEERR